MIEAEPIAEKGGKKKERGTNTLREKGQYNTPSILALLLAHTLTLLSKPRQLHFQVVWHLHQAIVGAFG